jgi:SAM-dependent methyltransferase
MIFLDSDTYIRYLDAKKRIDDRALNRYVWQKLRQRLPAATPRQPLRVIELGGGIGTMLQRALDWGLADHLHYTLVEINPDFVAAFQARSSQTDWCPGLSLAWQNPATARWAAGRSSGAVRVVCSDLFEIIEDPGQHGQWDLILAHAVMDLVDAAQVLEGMARMARPGGLIYLSLNYDGWSAVLPEGDPTFENQIWHRYHQSMDNRRRKGRSAGASQTGRRLLTRLPDQGLPILAAGSSDWIVHPQAGRYLADEVFFLETIIQTIVNQLRSEAGLDAGRLADWADRRRAQVQCAQLIYMARNMDILAYRPDH